jgi:dTDP-4-dehydrorhamnose reductase
MKILLLGASSYVGARLYTDLCKDFDVVGTYYTNKLLEDFIHLDVTDGNEVDKVITTIRPDVIVHAANNANGRWCEANPEAAKALNEGSTKHIVTAANKVKARLIYISSFAAIEPTNVYGKTKHASELLTKQTQSGWTILRPSLIVGYSLNTSNDRPFNRILKNLNQGTKAEYDTSWRFQPTWLGHISEVIARVANENITEQIIPIAVEELKSRYDLAADILKPFAIEVTPIDIGDNSSIFKEDLDILKELGLPGYGYEQIIENIVGEIKQRNL